MFAFPADSRVPGESSDQASVRKGCFATCSGRFCKLAAKSDLLMALKRVERKSVIVSKQTVGCDFNLIHSRGMVQHHRVKILANKLHRLPHHNFRRQDQVLVQYHDTVSLASVRSVFSLIPRSPFIYFNENLNKESTLSHSFRWH